ncbi:MAG: protein kinase, partial [Oscillospiraceae bacterium]|nr:protein kinase [Oscillospiraceae bacterium]
MKIQRISLLKGNTLTLSGNEYVIKKQIGYGASCLAYEAKKQGFLGHSVIIKEFYPLKYAHCIKRCDDNLTLSVIRNETLIEKLKKEFMTGAEKEVAFYDNDTNHRLGSYSTFAESNGTAYLIKDLAHGQILANCRETLSLCDIAQVMQSLCNAMNVLHNAGNLYLDIKPENIFVFNKDVSYRIGIFDFDTVIENNKDILDKSLGMGSKYWSPPEQKTWTVGSIGTATDIFAIGAVFYWLISGKNAEDDWLEEVIDSVYSGDWDFLKESPKIQGFVNATETAKKILSETLLSSADERMNKVEELAGMFNKFEKESETRKENEPVVDKIDALIKMLENKLNQINVSYPQHSNDTKESRFNNDGFIAELNKAEECLNNKQYSKSLLFLNKLISLFSYESICDKDILIDLKNFLVKFA